MGRRQPIHDTYNIPIVHTHTLVNRIYSGGTKNIRMRLPLNLYGAPRIGAYASKVDMRHIQYQGETLPPGISVWAGIR